MLTRIDVCWSAVAGLSIVDPIQGADYQERGLLLALRAGEPYRIARALAMEAAHLSTAGQPGAARVNRLLEQAGALAEQVGHPHAQGMVALARALAVQILGQWKRAVALWDHAEEILRERCTGVAWELDTAHSLALWAITHLGDLNELRRRWPILLKEAQERSDLYAVTTLNTYYMTVLRLADDDPEAARRELAEAMQSWTHRGFHIQHSIAFRAQNHIDIYRGDYGRAWEGVCRYWPTYQRSMLLRVQSIRIEMLEIRARTALAAASVASDPHPYWRAAARAARRLLRERTLWADTHAQFIQAGITVGRGEIGDAVTRLRAVAAQYDSLDMALDAAVVRRRIGELIGGSEGRDLVEEADRWMTGQKIQDPSKMAGLYAPGFSRHP